MTTINPLPPEPAPATDPTVMPVPPMALPPLPAYPGANGTDAQRDQWLRLAALYQAEAQRLTCWTSRLAVLPAVDQVVGQWAAHDAAMDRHTAALNALAGMQLPGVGGGSDLEAIQKVATIVIDLIKALKGNA